MKAVYFVEYIYLQSLEKLIFKLGKITADVINRN